ncbi:aminoglycoside phosphotransferase family protein [Luteococcus peritonei]|uniref:Aminoglycoside phosphotransferase family protein n=1 Tax=Luteococcus peritonei TaxID=88874 RepID=A0ABW4RXY5_9ACTN
MTLHADEHAATPADLHRLLTVQAPQWAGIPLREAGHGTDNVMLRMGDDLVARCPRTASTVPDLEKETTWLPLLAPQLTLEVPEMIFRGEPDEQYPFPWAVYRWIDGSEPDSATVQDWEGFGQDLGRFVGALHGIPVPSEATLPRCFRGGRLAAQLDAGLQAIGQIGHSPSGKGLDLDAVEDLWRDLAATPQEVTRTVWLHGDLRGANLLVRDGRLTAVIDFGTLGVGLPPAEHAPIWEFPRAARDAYRAALDLDDTTWRLARGWALLPSLTGLPYYWDSWPEFAALCRRRIDTLLASFD